MSFIKRFFQKETPTWEDVEKFVRGVGKDERSLFDFKAAGAAREKPSTKLCKCISSFANTEGGLVLLGVREDKSDAAQHALEPVAEGKEAVEHRIQAGIEPTIQGLKIEPVRSDQRAIYLIDVPQSNNPPHMLVADRGDCRYYIRRNFESEPMRHGEVEAAFLRRGILSRTTLEIFVASQENDRFIEKLLPNQPARVSIRNAGEFPASEVSLFFMASPGLDFEVQPFVGDCLTFNYSVPLGKHAARAVLQATLYPGEVVQASLLTVKPPAGDGKIAIVGNSNRSSPTDLIVDVAAR